MTRKVLTLGEDRFWSKVQLGSPSECWHWTGSRDGYGYGMFRVNGSKVRRAHRVAYEMVHGLVADGTVFLHSCDTPSCVNPAHLAPGTRAENNADRDAKGRHRAAAGEEHPQALLTEAAVADIRSAPRHTKGICAALAKKYGVSIGTIYQIRSGRNWKGVTA